LRIDPAFADPHSNLGVALSRIGLIATPPGGVECLQPCELFSWRLVLLGCVERRRIGPRTREHQPLTRILEPTCLNREYV
jgi:hypothetical protein